MSNELFNLDDVIGQSAIVKWFKSAIKRDALPQVIMLQGPAGTGKSSIAKIVACEIACMSNPSQLESVKDKVIKNHESTDCVRVYNMSNLKSQEAVQEVKTDLHIGFSSTGRKVIIMDEAHGMSQEAQDSLLVQFESLQEHLYIIVCSTELDAFRDAFISRCVLRRVTTLGQQDMKKLLKTRINQRNLKFTLGLDMVLSLIATYSGREPRRAINLIDSFEESSEVTVEDLESFMNVFQGKQLVMLISYLYSGNVLLGLDYVQNMPIDSILGASMLEVLRVAEGGRSSILDKESVIHIRDIVASEGTRRLVGFTIDVTSTKRLSNTILGGMFLKWCSAMDKQSEAVVPRKHTLDEIKLQDLQIMQTSIDSNDNNSIVPCSNKVGTLTELLDSAAVVYD